MQKKWHYGTFNTRLEETWQVVWDTCLWNMATMLQGSPSHSNGGSAERNLGPRLTALAEPQATAVMEGDPPAPMALSLQKPHRAETSHLHQAVPKLQVFEQNR